MTRKKLTLIALGAGLLLAIALVVFLGRYNSLGARLRRDPAAAVRAGMDRVMDLPEPLALGFLGAVDTPDQTLNCSGTVEVQATDRGLAVFLADCTLGSQEGETTFSLYADPDRAAAWAPDQLGVEGWYGVELTTPLAHQAAGTGYETIYSQADRARAQQSADALSQALGAVTDLTFAAERAAILDFLTGCEATVTDADRGWTVSFVGTDPAAIHRLAEALALDGEWLGQRAELTFNLSGGGGVTGLALSGQGLEAALDLGTDAPEKELSPRLKVTWTDEDGQSWWATLALTVDRGEPVTAPSYQNALALLGQN